MNKTTREELLFLCGLALIATPLIMLFIYFYAEVFVRVWGFLG